MLSHWLIVVPKRAASEREVPKRIEAGLSQFLYYKPERVLLHRYEPGIWVASTSAGTDIWCMDWPLTMDRTECLALGGVPTLENIESGIGSIPERLLFAIRDRGLEWVQVNVGGSFSIGWLRSTATGGQIEATSDFSGYSSCFFLDDERYFAVGNRASFVAAFRPGFPETNEIDAAAMSWLPGTTMVMGDRTVFAGVTRLRAGMLLGIEISAEGVVGQAQQQRITPSHLDALAGTTVDTIDYGAICARVGRRVRWCSSEGIRLWAHLTGGRDTRVVAGILADQDLLGAVSRFTTNGTEKNGDVVVARQLARSMGIESSHVVTAGSKGDEALKAADVHRILLRSPFVYECQLTPFDGRRFAIPRMGREVTLMGGGGEVYRQEWGPARVLRGAHRGDRALGLFSRYDPLGLLSDEAKQEHLTVIERELEFLGSLDVVNLSSAFYMEERLSNWGCGHFSNAPSTQFPILLDRSLTRSVLSMADISEHVHFELLRHCGRGLLEIPFLNNRWAEGTEKRAAELGLPTDPMVVPAEHSFPWQFDCYRRLRDAVIDFCISCGDSIADYVPRTNLEKLRKTPIEPFGSAHIKMLFGLCGAIILAENAWLRNRDRFEGDEPEIRGNQVEAIRVVSAEEPSANSVVADELERLLLGADGAI